MKTIKDLPEALEKDNIITFWKPNGLYGCFSNWYPAKVDEFPTSEHAMMYNKALLFDDMNTASKIARAETPREVQKLGRLVNNFNQTIWDKYKEKIVINVLVKKFTQNPKLGSLLLDTGDKILIEASPLDKIWGVGLAEDSKCITKPSMWNGQNLLGFCLMEVRNKLKQLI